MDLTILIPCKNDKINLIQVIKEIKINYPNIFILVIIENINDFDLSLRDNYSNINYILQTSSGYGSALIEGIKNIKTKFFVIHNADGSFEINKIKEMYDLTNKFDFVFCNRYEKNAGSEDDTILTFVGNKVFSLLSKFLLNIRLNDVLYTHVLCNTSMTQSFKLKQLDFTFCIELPFNIFKNNYKVISIPTFEKKRLSGKKNVNEFKDGFLILIYIFKLFIIKFFNKER